MNVKLWNVKQFYSIFCFQEPIGLTVLQVAIAFDQHKVLNVLLTAAQFAQLDINKQNDEVKHSTYCHIMMLILIDVETNRAAFSMRLWGQLRSCFNFAKAQRGHKLLQRRGLNSLSIFSMADLVTQLLQMECTPLRLATNGMHLDIVKLLLRELLKQCNATVQHIICFTRISQINCY